MIVVTGASRGIGRSIAERLSANGQEVIGISRNRLPESSFESIEVDITNPDAVKSTARSIRARKTPVVALINAAGIASMNLALMASPTTTRQIVDTNLLGTITTCQQFAPLIIRAGSGTIINFSTIAVVLGLQGESAYVASKAAVEAFSRTLARELAPHDITVNCIAPGPIATDLLKGVSAQQIDRVIARQILQRQFGTRDVCDVVEILLDKRTRSLTGHVLHVGGV